METTQRLELLSDQLITEIAQELQLPETVVRDTLRTDTSYPVHTTISSTTYKRATYIHVPMGGVEHTTGKLAGWRMHTLQPDEKRGLKTVEVPGRKVDEVAARVWAAIEAKRKVRKPTGQLYCPHALEAHEGIDVWKHEANGNTYRMCEQCHTAQRQGRDMLSTCRPL